MSGSVFSGKPILPKFGWLLYLRSITLALRVILFDTYSGVVTFAWWLFVLLAAVVSGMLHWGAAAGCIGVGVLLYRPFLSWMLSKRRHLLRKGDLVEYTVASETETPSFSRGRILYAMRPEDVAKTSLFTKGEAGFYEYFYLLSTAEKNYAVPYEWIMAIEIDDQIEKMANV